MSNQAVRHPLFLLSVAALLALSPTVQAQIIDRLTFGDAASESAHTFSSKNTETIKGLLDEPARRLLPPETADWQGGSLSFKIAIEPNKPNYLTVRFSGSELSPSRMYIYIDGKQLGYRHLGDYDCLDFGSETNGGPYPGRFYYVTTLLPLSVTAGKTSLNIEIRSTGQMWGYGTTFEKYQKNMTIPTRGLYKIYSHLDPCFTPPPNEPQGTAPTPASASETKIPGPEILDQIKARLTKELNGFINGKNPLNQPQINVLARAYHVKWSPAYHNPAVIKRLVTSIDAVYLRYKQDPNTAINDPATFNPDWFGVGMVGDAIRLVAPELTDYLDKPVEGATDITRRAGWSDMLQFSRDWNRKHRRLYTNQTMIKDLNIYRANKGIQAIDPSNAFSEEQVCRYLYESLGLIPWTDSDRDAGRGGDGKGPAETGGKPWNVGPNYMQLTAKGLTKELGFVGYYGEVIDWVAQIYDATRMSGEEGNPKIKAALEKIANARAMFRYPTVNVNGTPTMRIETIVGWRDAHYPGDVVYAERASWDASPIYAAAATLDDQAVGYVHQMFADNQFFPVLAKQAEGSGIRVSGGLLGVPDQYETLSSIPVKSSRPKLPMTPGQPDFVFSDEENAVVAIKNGNDILYASLYWRARNAINNLARVHYITPSFDRVATVRVDTQFTPSGMFYTRTNATNFGFGNGGPKYPIPFDSIHAGEKLPIAQIPEGVSFKAGDENVHAGKGEFYTLRYGPYLIALNTTTTKTFSIPPVSGHTQLMDLVTQKPLNVTSPIKVGPRSTVVLLFPESK